MEAFIAIGVGFLLMAWAWSNGKREGSKKGYHVGRQHERKHGGKS